LNERQLSILNKVINTPKINVAELSKESGVSQVTIRQDLRILEQNGMLKRFHGGAMPVSDDDIMKRLSYNFDVKLNIAQMAASLVSNGETVLIESGSTNALLARELTKKSDITIITNSAFISRYVRGNNIKVTLLGGDYQHESEVLVGPLARICLKQFHVDKVFIGVDGFSPDIGFTCVNLMRAEIAHAMADQAEKTIIVTDSSKFSKIGVACSFKAEDVDIVITDKNISEDHLRLLESFNIEVITV
jgi:DeoR/GlpR family transcriptional regulator of sugar metabolism